MNVPGFGAFDGYANRDSLKYRSHYGIDDIPTLKRGTLRKAGYCVAWNAFVQLGCTDDSYTMELPARCHLARLHERLPALPRHARYSAPTWPTTWALTPRAR